MIELRQWAGRGIDFMDAHLLTSALPPEPAGLWAPDRKLQTVADGLIPG